MNVGGTSHKLGGPDYVERGEQEKSEDKSKPAELSIPDSHDEHATPPHHDGLRPLKLSAPKSLSSLILFLLGVSVTVAVGKKGLIPMLASNSVRS